MLLDGSDLVVKKRFFARKSWVSLKAEELRDEAFQYLNQDEFTKQNVSRQRIVEKQALIQHLQTELIILKSKMLIGLDDIENCATFQRFSLDYRHPDFITRFKKLIDKLTNEMNRYVEVISKDAEKTKDKLSFEDSITENIILINGGMIDKNTITAKDFYIMLKEHKRKNTPKNGK